MPDKPLIAITMGDPAGIGPELIHLSFSDPKIHSFCRPFIIGDKKILETAKKFTKSSLEINIIKSPEDGQFEKNCIDLINIEGSDPVSPGSPTKNSGRAMIDYIENAILLANEKKVSAIVTCPINKAAMQLAQSTFHGHTELLAVRTGTEKYAMMMAGDRLKVVLVTIHIAFDKITEHLNEDKILETIEITNTALKNRFGISKPSIGVAGLNPHAGEDGLFGDEESTIISPAIKKAVNMGIYAKGPYPPDTVYHKASSGDFDAVISMYHDQGLIPFKMIHFSDGVNTTLGLPIIRTSVDHGTAYDIAGTGKADPRSLLSAVKMAAFQAENSI